MDGRVLRRFTRVVNVTGTDKPTISHCQIFRHALALIVLLQLVELMTVAHTIFCKQIGEPLTRRILNWVVTHSRCTMTGD